MNAACAPFLTFFSRYHGSGCVPTARCQSLRRRSSRIFRRPKLRTSNWAQRRDAQALDEAGAFAVVLELVPAQLAKVITERIKVPTIGIGAGPACDGQVQVISDMLGLYTDFVPRHAKQFAHLGDAMRAGVESYASAVKTGSFPTSEHGSTLEDEVLQELLAGL